MRLLLSNDDGYDSPGLMVLAERLRADHELWVVAPDSEQSAKSHSLTMHDPLRLIERGYRQFSVTGTPADCAYIALHHVMPEPPDLVISGVNRGSNLGGDVHYSGTVAAAREGALHGIPGIAVSLAMEGKDEPHWDTAASIGVRVVDAVATHPMGPRLVYNVNVPDRSLSDIRGIRACRLSVRVYEPMVDRRQDPRGKPYLWIGGPHLRFEGGPDTDGTAVHEGWATVTPISCDITNDPELERIRGWTDD